VEELGALHEHSDGMLFKLRAHTFSWQGIRDNNSEIEGKAPLLSFKKLTKTTEIGH